MSAPAIPWDALDTLFLDAGNTLVSMDFAWIAGELAGRGIACTEEQLERAEAAARPEVSRRLAEGRSTEALDTFALYFGAVLARLDAARGLGASEREALMRELVPILRAPGRTARLWSRVLPRVPEALGVLRDAGLRLLVVSNSDGSAERSIAESGLRGYFDAVVDSHLVGSEKPDPGIFRHALELAGSEPGGTLHVGDMYHADVVGARAAGLHALLLDPFDDWGGVDCARSADLWSLSRTLLGARGRSPRPPA